MSGYSTTNSFAYTGRELDATGLYFYRARYYDPPLQRFVSEDPIGFRGGINVYAYTANSPVNFFDSLGLDKQLDKQEGCPVVPAHPSDANVDDNIILTQETNSIPSLDDEDDSRILESLYAYAWWLDMIGYTGSPWDYKNYNGQTHPEFDNFGNFNFGATGAQRAASTRA